MDKQTAIQELKRLQKLKIQKRNISEDIQDYNRQISFHEEECASAITTREKEISQKLSDAKIKPDCPNIATRPSIYEYVGIIPPEKRDFRKLTIIRSCLLAVSSIFAFLFLRSLFLALIGQLEDPEGIGNILLFLAGGPAFGVWGYSLYYLVSRPEQKANERQCEEYRQAVDKFNKMQENYEAEAGGCVAENEKQLQSYELAYKQAVINYMYALSEHKVDLEKLETFKQRVMADCEAKKQIYLEQLAQAQEKLDFCNAQLDKIDILHVAHWDLVDAIVQLLETGRADNCKEALNMAIEQKAQQEHYEAMEELRRQELEEIKQENRRAEEARQEQRLQEQLAREETRRHNMVMERQQEEHNRAMQRAEQDRMRAEVLAMRAANSAARQAESEASAKAWTQCRVCAKRSGCRNPGIPGCGAFVPRR